MTAPDLIVGGLSVRVDWTAIMRRIRWAARLAGLSVPKRVAVLGRSNLGRSCDPVKAAGDCQRTRDGYRITICTGAAWLASVEEVLVHEVAHAVAWPSEGAGTGHTPAWAACYGAIYSGYFDRKGGPPRPAFAVKTIVTPCSSGAIGRTSRNGTP